MRARRIAICAVIGAVAILTVSCSSTTDTTVPVTGITVVFSESWEIDGFPAHDEASLTETLSTEGALILLPTTPSPTAGATTASVTVLRAVPSSLARAVVALHTEDDNLVISVSSSEAGLGVGCDYRFSGADGSPAPWGAMDVRGHPGCGTAPPGAGVIVQWEEHGHLFQASSPLLGIDQIVAWLSDWRLLPDQ